MKLVFCLLVLSLPCASCGTKVPEQTSNPASRTFVNMAYACDIHLYDYHTNEADSQYLLAKRSYCLDKDDYLVKFADRFFMDNKGHTIGLNVVMDLTGQRLDRGDGTALITTFNLNNPEDLHLPRFQSFHTNGSTWDRVGDNWLYVACTKISSCKPTHN